MIETLITIGIVALFSVLAWAVNAGAETMIWGGIAIVGVGFVYGIPTAIVYHWMLYRSLVRAERLPDRWWLAPTSHHGLIPTEDRAGVFLWGAIGGTGFLVIVLGILITAVGLWRTLVVPSMAA